MLELAGMDPLWDKPWRKIEADMDPGLFWSLTEAQATMQPTWGANTQLQLATRLSVAWLPLANVCVLVLLSSPLAQLSFCARLDRTRDNHNNRPIGCS